MWKEWMKEDYVQARGREVEKGRYPFPNILALSWAAFGMVLLNWGPASPLGLGGLQVTAFTF